MSKVLFMNGPGAGHVNPTLGLVKELIHRGEEVIYFSTEDYREKVEKTGATFHSYPDFLEDLNREHAQHFTLLNMCQVLLRSANEVVSAVLDKTDGETFDYIIHDSVFGSGKMLAEKLQLPAISSITTFAFKGFPEFMTIDIGTEAQRKETEKLAKQIAEKYQISPPKPEEIFFQQGDMNIVYTSRLFQPQDEDFDDDFLFVGPSIADRQEAIAFPFELLTEQKVIYISLGTIVNDNIAFYEDCFKAFEDFTGKVVLSVGDRINIEDIQEVPEHFIVRPYVPQLEVLEQADLFITHGGMNSTNEALYYNVPLLVIPQTSDQPYVAERVSALGAGLTMDKTAVTPEKLRDTAETILRESIYKQNSTAIGDSFRQAGGYQKAVEAIFAFKKRPCIPDHSKV